MKKANITELVFILDRSGSMSGLERDTIGGFNSMLEEQKKGKKEVLVTTVLFDDKYDILYDSKNIKEVNAITDKEYYPRGSTALLDAVGKTINKIGQTKNKVLIVITTDGMENSSREYNYTKIKEMIINKQKKEKWEFIFLGANIDAVEVASFIGIDSSRAQRYHADAKGVSKNYETLSKAICSFTQNEELSEGWNDDIKKDYEQREKGN